MSRRIVLALLPLVVLAACGDDEVARPPAATSPGTTPTTLTPTTTAPGAVPVDGVYEGVSFYPACGNETLQHEGVTWYQVQEYDYPDVWAAIFDVERIEPAVPLGFRGAARVVDPGPGDDVGTLVVWADGVARFVADSGDLTAWMVDDELTYEWVC